MRLLKPKDVALDLGISIKTLHRLCREGKIGYVRLDGKQRAFRPEQVEYYIEQCTVKPSVNWGNTRPIKK